MNDEWKMPGTEQEENQQPVGEESEVTEATAVKEPEAGETAEAMPEATESQEPEVWERVEVTETTEEAATNGDGQVAKTEEEKPRYPWEAVLGTEEKKEQPADVTDTPVQPQEQPVQQSGAQPENSREAASYHWVNPDYQKRQNGVDGGERASQNTYENQNTGRMSAGQRIHKITQRQQPNHRITEAGDSRSVEIIQQKRWKTAVLPDRQPGAIRMVTGVVRETVRITRIHKMAERIRVGIPGRAGNRVRRTVR